MAGAGYEVVWQASDSVVEKRVSLISRMFS